MSTEKYKSHISPRTKAGAAMLVWIIFCYLMVEWPVLEFANRIHPFIGGVSFLYFWLSFWYILLVIGIFVTAWKVWKP